MKKVIAQPLDLNVDTPELVRQVSATISLIEDETIAAFRQSVSGITAEERSVMADVNKLTSRLQQSGAELSKAGRLRLERALHLRVEDAVVLFRSRPDDFYPQTVARGSGLFSRDLADEKLFADRLAYLNFYSMEAVKGLIALRDRADFAMLYETVDRDREEAASDYRAQLESATDELIELPTDPNFYRRFLALAELHLSVINDTLKMTSLGEFIPFDVQPLDMIGSIALEEELRHRFATAVQKGVWYACSKGDYAPTDAVPILLMEGIDRANETPSIRASLGLAWGPRIISTNETIVVPIDTWMDRDSGAFSYFSASGRHSLTGGSYSEAGLLPGHIVGQRDVYFDDADFADELDEDGIEPGFQIEPGEVESFWLLGAARFEALVRAYELRSFKDVPDKAVELEAMSKDWGFNGREGIDF